MKKLIHSLVVGLAFTAIQVERVGAQDEQMVPCPPGFNSVGSQSLQGGRAARICEPGKDSGFRSMNGTMAKQRVILCADQECVAWWEKEAPNALGKCKSHCSKPAWHSPNRAWVYLCNSKSGGGIWSIPTKVACSQLTW